MKDKHIKIKQDSDLLKALHNAIKSQINPKGIKGKIKLILKAIAFTALLIASYISIYKSKSSVFIFISYIIYGMTGLLLVFNYAHDLSHNALFKNKKLNNFLYTCIFTLVGAHAEGWKKRHVSSHHYAPNVKDYDTDLQITSIIRVEPTADHKWYHKFQWLYAPFTYSTYSFYWVFIKDFVVYSKGIQNRKFKAHFSFWLQKFIYVGGLLVLPLLIADQNSSSILAAFLAMHLIKSVFLLFTFFITHHIEETEYFNVDQNGYIETSWFNNQLKSSNDFFPFSPIAKSIFGGFNNHVAHHLFPHINHIHYPKMNKIIYQVLQDHGIQPNQSSYLGGVLSHLRHLKTMGKETN